MMPPTAMNHRVRTWHVVACILVATAFIVYHEYEVAHGSGDSARASHVDALADGGMASSRRGALRPGDVAVLQVFVPLTDKWNVSGSHAQVGSKAWIIQSSIKSWRAYCERHGYKYILEEKSWNTTLPIHFTRFLATKHHLRNYKYVFYVDADVVVQRPELPLTALLSDGNEDCDLIASDLQGFYDDICLAPCETAGVGKDCPSHISAGVYLSHSTRAMDRVLARAIALWPKYTEWVVNGRTGLDQGALEEAIITDSPARGDAPLKYCKVAHGRINSPSISFSPTDFAVHYKLNEQNTTFISSRQFELPQSKSSKGMDITSSCYFLEQLDCPSILRGILNPEVNKHHLHFCLDMQHVACNKLHCGPFSLFKANCESTPYIVCGPMKVGGM